MSGLTTVGVSRTSSCEVLVDDDASQRLDDVTTRRAGVSLSRRSSPTSSAADDISETDSLAAYSEDQNDDQVTDSLLDHLLMRLQCPVTPDDSSEQCLFAQTSVGLYSFSSSDDDDEVDLSSAVDAAVQRTTAGPVWVAHKHNSLLSSLNDISSDSDIELGSSLSHLMIVTPGKDPHRKSPHHNPFLFRGRVPMQAASVGDLSHHTDDRLNKYRDWLDDCNYIPPRETHASEISVNSEAICSTTNTGLAAPITESQPAEVHVARTSRIQKY